MLLHAILLPLDCIHKKQGSAVSRQSQGNVTVIMHLPRPLPPRNMRVTCVMGCDIVDSFSRLRVLVCRKPEQDRSGGKENKMDSFDSLSRLRVLVCIPTTAPEI